nr:MAG TPA: hypothetical protein [Crassvirales sp.]
MDYVFNPSIGLLLHLVSGAESNLIISQLRLAYASSS